MKLHRLELEGFGPFRTRQTVAFDAFDDDGIFLIAGRTGAGKSSILDGVCFALYGGVPRYDGAEKRIRSDYCTPDEPTEVRLEFSVGGTRWRVARAPEYERPKARGAGLTVVPHAARLEELVGGEWIGRAAKPREVGALLDEIIGLNQQQFLQVILLAQNRFAQFLLAKNDDRQALLRTLFGSRTYSGYQDALEQRRRAATDRLEGRGALGRLVLDEADRLIAEHELGGDGAGEEPAPDDIAARLAAAERAARRAAYRVETLARERDEAESAHVAAVAALAERTALREKQLQRDASRAQLATLDAAAPAVARDRARLSAAVAAELLRDPVERAERSAAAAARAVETATAARGAWEALAGSASVDTPTSHALAALVDAMTGDLARWEAVAAQERELPALLDRLAVTERSLATLEEQRTAVGEQIAGLPALRAALDDEIVAHQAIAAGLRPAQTALAVARERQDAGREAERLADARAAAEAAHAAALATAAAASSAVATLLQRRLDGHAGELAAELVDGQPCAVCGSTDHPRPAREDADPVTDEAIERAEEEKGAAVEAERVASDRARRAREAHAAAAARAGGAEAAELDAAVLAAEKERAAAAEATAHLERLTADRLALQELETAAVAQRTALEDRLAGERTGAAVLRQQVSTARTAVDAAKGGFASVADRVADTDRRRGLARSLAEALEVQAAREAEAAADAEERDARIEASDFDDTEAARAALLPADTRVELEERIHGHDLARTVEVGRLRALELELAGAPDAPVDLSAEQETVAVAKRRWSTALELATRATAAAEALQSAIARAADAHAEVAALSADHEVVAGLAHAVAGRNERKMDLETFVLAAELEEIVAAANLRLDEMSAGRYLLRHTDALAGRGAAGLGLEVVDAYTGHARPPQSLSGGETFLASLALALGLAQVVTEAAGGIRLDTLFIDEGFGSLDAETLELAMRTLDELRQGGRTVGIISHVEAMKEQLPAQLVVRSTTEGPSIIAQDALADA